MNPTLEIKPGIQNRLIALLLLGLVSSVSHAKETGFGSPDAVPNQLAEDEISWSDFKKGLTEEGLNFSIDSVTLAANQSLPGADDNASGGMLRFYGQWDVTGKGTASTGSPIWKLEHRHAYTDTSPKDFLFGAGALGLDVPPFSDEETRLTNFYWKQRLNDGRSTIVAGMLDSTDYVDVFVLASPWTGFVNFAFSTGTTTIALPGDAALGAAGATMLGDQFFVIGGLVDMLSDPTDPLEGFETFFDDNQYFKSIEFGWTPDQKNIYTDNIHVTIWHADESETQGTAEGQGYNLSYSRLFGQWLPFIRGGYSEDAGTLAAKSISLGTGYFGLGGESNKLGVGFNWAEIDAADDQYTTEIFYLVKATKWLEVTPDIQWIKNPALNADESSITVLGLRGRAIF